MIPRRLGRDFPRPSGWRRPTLVGLCLGLGLASAPGSSRAQEAERVAREIPALEAEAERFFRAPLRVGGLRSPTYVEERLAEGEVFLQLGDPLRASIIFTDVVDHFPAHRAYPDALYLLGESLFQAGDLYGARKRFREVAARAEKETSFRDRLEAAIVRLIEIAIQTRDFREIEDQIATLDRAARSQVGGSSSYYHGKYLFGRAVPAEQGGGVAVVDRRALDEAERVFGQIGRESPWYARARYHLGVIHVLSRDLEAAMKAFEDVRGAEGQGDDHREVRELASLALGRLLYEDGRYIDGADAYQQIPRSSPHFPRALFEIAWVYIALGDPIQAERALEVLAVVDPESPLIADAKILRGNLLLQNGRFDEADAVFQEAREAYGPIARELDAVYESHADMRAHFRELVRRGSHTFDESAFLGAHVRSRVETTTDFRRALRVMRDLADARQLLGEAEGLAVRLEGALRGTQTVGIFSDLREQAEGLAAVRAQISVMLGALVRLEEQPSRTTGEIAEVQRARKALEERLAMAPAVEDEFVKRRNSTLEEIRDLHRELRALEVVLAGNDARIVATERFLETGALDATLAESARAELSHHRVASREFRATIEDTRQLLDVLRLQAGTGDSVVASARLLRREHAALVERERDLSGGDPRLDALFARLFRLSAALSEREDHLSRVAEERVAEIRAVLDEEIGRLDGLTRTLGALATEAEDVVSAVALAQFLAVRARFHDLVIRADVGRIDIAWAIREEHRKRIESLSLDRMRELGALDAEFREIMMDADEPQSGGRR